MVTQLSLAVEPQIGRRERCGRCDGLAWFPDWAGVKCGACGHRPADVMLDRDGRKRRSLPEQSWGSHIAAIVRRYDADRRHGILVTALRGAFGD